MVDLQTLSCDSKDLAAISAEVFKRGKTLRFQASGFSMHPLIRDGDILSIIPILGNAIHIGDVVFCLLSPGLVVIHRVMKIKRNRLDISYLIKGDQAQTPDGWLTREKITGKVTCIERGDSTIRMNQPLMGMLGLFQVIRFRTNFGSGRITQFIWGRIRRLPPVRKLVL